MNNCWNRDREPIPHHTVRRAPGTSVRTAREGGLVHRHVRRFLAAKRRTRISRSSAIGHLRGTCQGLSRLVPVNGALLPTGVLDEEFVVRGVELARRLTRTPAGLPRCRKQAFVVVHAGWSSLAPR